MRDGITVFVPKGFSVLLWGCSAVLALVPVGFALAGELPPVGAAVFAALIAPFVLAGVVWRRFRMTVWQGVVAVRPCFGRAWSFSTVDVTRVVRRVNPNGESGELAKMTVWAGRRRVSMEALMQGSEVFWAYIEQNVAPDKIVTKGRGRRGGHEAR